MMMVFYTFSFVSLYTFLALNDDNRAEYSVLVVVVLLQISAFHDPVFDCVYFERQCIQNVVCLELSYPLPQCSDHFLYNNSFILSILQGIVSSYIQKHFFTDETMISISKRTFPTF